uniref:ARAD1C15334p n=1 Tax=Blastobotrys adeninivorans TaxID=409370 RepID=A0A060T6N6_BLAAD
MAEVLDKQTDAMVTLKLIRILEVHRRLKDDLSRKRMFASSACLEILKYTQKTRDYCIPQLWGYLDDEASIEDRHDTCCVIS